MSSSVISNPLQDGFPRTKAQAEKLDTVLNIDAAFLIDVPKEVILGRLQQRWVHRQSGRTYSYDFNPPKIHGKDDITGDALELREDDKAEVVSRRLDIYENSIAPVLEHYRGRGVLGVFQGTESPVIYNDVHQMITEIM